MEWDLELKAGVLKNNKQTRKISKSQKSNKKVEKNTKISKIKLLGIPEMGKNSFKD